MSGEPKKKTDPQKELWGWGSLGKWLTPNDVDKALVSSLWLSARHQRDLRQAGENRKALYLVPGLNRCVPVKQDG